MIKFSAEYGLGCLITSLIELMSMTVIRPEYRIKI